MNHPARLLPPGRDGAGDLSSLVGSPCDALPMASLSRPDGATISYSAEGDGPAVLVHPGVSMPGGSLPRCAADPLVAAGHTVITIDPRDTGGSTRYDPAEIDPTAVLGGDFTTVPYTFEDMAGDAIAVLDDLGVGSATWVGYSMGGEVVRCVQALVPERVDGIVYFESAPGFGSLSAEASDVLLRPAPTSRDEAIGWALDVMRWTLGSDFDEATCTPVSVALVDDFGWWGIPLGHLAASVVGAPGVTTYTPDERRTLILYGHGTDQRDISGFQALAAALPGATAIDFGPYNHWFPEPGPWPTITAAIHQLSVGDLGGQQPTTDR